MLEKMVSMNEEEGTA